MVYAEDRAGTIETPEQTRFLPVADTDRALRVDVFLARELAISRANAQKLLKNALVAVKERPLKQNYRLCGGELLSVDYQPPRPIKVEPENLPLEIIYQDEDFVVVNKARGMVVHPAAGHQSGTLVNALLYHCRDLSGINGYIRPGIVHRLDKDTSGVMVVAKNDNAHVELAAQIQNKTARREYLALAHGRVKDAAGEIRTLIGRDAKDRQKMAVVTAGGREAVTQYKVLEYFGAYTLLSVRLLTGRTHQIRVHLSCNGHPLVGDPKYLPRRHPFAINGQALHSHKLEFLSLTGQKLSFTAELPADMAEIIRKLRGTA